MATWREFENYLSSSYKFEKLSSNCIKMGFRFDDGRTQLIFMEGLALDDQENAVVAFSSPFARVDQLTPQQLVNCMADNGFLGVVMDSDMYMLRHVVPLANLDASEIEWPLRFVTEMADEIEKSLGLGDDL